jgi:uncharacterized protein (DUF433 family)
MVAILGHGVYSFREASSFTKLKVARIREWFRIRGDRHPVFTSRYGEPEGEYAISFLDLVDVFVAGQLRTHGVSLQTLRKVHKKLMADLDTDHPFSRKELLTDGKIVYVSDLTPRGKEEIREALSGQGVFREIILPFLRRIDYDQATSLALRWHIADHIVLDPTICFGQPIVEDAGIPTYILSAAFHANDANVKKVAAWYNVTPSQVKAAVDFENSLPAA